jgi:hypothetical protein
MLSLMLGLLVPVLPAGMLSGSGKQDGPASGPDGPGGWRQRWNRWWGRPPRPVPPADVERSLERLVADLRRLEHEYQRIESSNELGRASRLRAIGMAYDDTLRACCRAVGLPAPERSPLTSIHRLQTEAALAQAGVTW